MSCTVDIPWRPSLFNKLLEQQWIWKNGNVGGQERAKGGNVAVRVYKRKIKEKICLKRTALLRYNS